LRSGTLVVNNQIASSKRFRSNKNRESPLVARFVPLC
jgi:hypothetical protein